MRSYYSKLQQRFIAREEYFDELLFGTLNDENYDSGYKVITKYYQFFHKNYSMKYGIINAFKLN